MSISHSNKRVTIDFPAELYRMMKAFAAFHDLSVRDLVVKAVNKQLGKNSINIPNDETLETFKKTDQGKELHHYRSFDDLLADLKKNGELK